MYRQAQQQKNPFQLSQQLSKFPFVSPPENGNRPLPGAKYGHHMHTRVRLRFNLPTDDDPPG